MRWLAIDLRDRLKGVDRKGIEKLMGNYERCLSKVYILFSPSLQGGVVED